MTDSNNSKSWVIQYIAEARKEYDKLDGSQRPQVFKALNKVAQNPLPDYEGGYGKPLGNKGGNDLTGLCKFKLRALGFRVVYRLIREGNTMRVLVISLRSDNEVYELAQQRKDM